MITLSGGELGGMIVENDESWLVYDSENPNSVFAFKEIEPSKFYRRDSETFAVYVGASLPVDVG